MADYSQLPEWIQREIEERDRAAERSRLRLALGALLFTLIAVALVLIAFRDRLPEGW